MPPGMRAGNAARMQPPPAGDRGAGVWYGYTLTERRERRAKCLKRIVFNIPTYEWIEGIGSKQGFLESNNPNQDPQTYLLCAYQNQENIFHHPFAENCLISLDIDEIHKRKDIIIYPTLFDNEVNIKSEVMDYSVGLYDIYGRSIFYKKTQKENLQINTSDLSKGIYLILIKDKTNNPIKVQKLIKN